jgi:hypothetical protein
MWVWEARSGEDARLDRVAAHVVGVARIRSTWGSHSDLFFLDAPMTGGQMQPSRRFDAIDAELMGWKRFPLLPRGCFDLVHPQGLTYDANEAFSSFLTLSKTRQEIEDRKEYYVPNQLPSPILVQWKPEKIAAGTTTWTMDSGLAVLKNPGRVLEALNRRLLSCGLDATFLHKPSLRLLPLLTWHLLNLADVSEDEGILAAMDLLEQMKFQSERVLIRVPPLSEFPEDVLAVLSSVYAMVARDKSRSVAEATDQKKILREKMKDVRAKLEVRSQVDTFREEEFLKWGHWLRRPCCGFNFFNMHGCDACLQAYEKGMKLYVLKKDTPKWKTLEEEVTTLEARLQILSIVYDV